MLDKYRLSYKHKPTVVSQNAAADNYLAIVPNKNNTVKLRASLVDRLNELVTKKQLDKCFDEAD